MTDLNLKDVLQQTDDSVILHCAAYHFDHNTPITTLALDQVTDYLNAYPDSYVWISLLEPELDLMLQLQRMFSLHALAIEDCLRPHQRTKVERYDDIDFMVLRTQILSDDQIHAGMMSIFLGDRFIISVRQGDNLSFEAVKANCERLPELLTIGPLYILHGMLDFAVDQFMPIQDHFERHIQAIEQDIFDSQFHRRMLKKIYHLKSELVKLRLVVNSYQDVCQHVMHNTQNKVHTQEKYDVMPYFRDVLDHVLRTVDALETYNEMLNVSMDTYLALVGISQNEVVKRLASWAAILAIPTLIASFYGMNFKNMPELSWHWGYYGVIFVMVFVTYLVYLRLKKARWI